MGIDPQAADKMLWQFDSVPWFQFSVDATPRWADVMSKGFDSPWCLGSTPGRAWWQESTQRKVGWVMRSPEVSPSSRDVVIACVVSSQKRGVDMTRGNYDSANNMLAYSNGNCPVLKTERGWKSLWVQILPQAPYAVLTELVRCRIANPRSGETLREFKSLRLRQGPGRSRMMLAARATPTENNKPVESVCVPERYDLSHRANGSTPAPHNMRCP